MHHRRLVLWMVLCIWLLAGITLAQNPPAPVQPAAAAAPRDDTPQSFLEIVHAGGLVGYVIMFLSVVAVALAIEHVMTIRQGVLMPAGLAEKVRELSKQGQFAQAEQACKLQPSVLAFVLQAGLSELDGGWSAVEKAMEDAIADQSARLFRKIEYLSVIGNIAPMLGLLGTVIGMVMAFREVALTQGAARAADLAEGIYLALVTTVQGLVVAIPALSAFAYFRNRVDQMIAETAYVAQHAMTPLKRAQAAAARAAGDASGCRAVEGKAALMLVRSTYMQRGSIGFNMTPMIDIVFLLIIFFILSSHFARQETQLELSLPEAASGQEAAVDETRRLIVSVSPDGQLHLAGAAVDAAELQQKIAYESQRVDGDLEVRIRSDRQAPYRQVEPILVACARAGVWKVTFAVMPIGQ